MRTERRRQDDAAADDGRLGRTRQRRHRETGNPHRGLPSPGRSVALGRTVFEEASSAFAELDGDEGRNARSRSDSAIRSIPESDHDAMLARYSDLQDGFRLHDGYNIELRTATVLQGLGFSAADFERRTGNLSAAGRCVSPSPNSCWAARISCCSTSPPIISTSRRAIGSSRI